MNRLIIIGASGHGKVVADIARLNGYNDIVFLDDDINSTHCGIWPVIGRSDDAPEGDLFVAIGNAKTRKRLMERYAGKTFPKLIHPSAVIAQDAEIGSGTVIMAGAVINPGTKIGSGCIVNTSASVDHDCIVEDYCHIAVGAHLCGTVIVGCGTWVGAGSVISNNVTVCGGCMIGAGAVVIHDISQIGTYVGVPAKMISKPKLTGGGYSPPQ